MQEITKIMGKEDPDNLWDSTNQESEIDVDTDLARSQETSIGYSWKV